MFFYALPIDLHIVSPKEIKQNQLQNWLPNCHLLPEINISYLIQVVSEGVNKKIDFLADMSAKLWTSAPLAFKKNKKVDFFHIFLYIYIPIEPECSKMDHFI